MDVCSWFVDNHIQLDWHAVVDTQIFWGIMKGIWYSNLNAHWLWIMECLRRSHSHIVKREVAGRDGYLFPCLFAFLKAVLDDLAMLSWFLFLECHCGLWWPPLCDEYTCMMYVCIALFFWAVLFEMIKIQDVKHDCHLRFNRIQF